MGKRKGKGKGRKKEEDDEEGPVRSPSVHFNDLKETSGAGKSFTHAPAAHSRTLEKAMEEEERTSRSGNTGRRSSSET